jgi:hypothetical protein
VFETRVLPVLRVLLGSRNDWRLHRPTRPTAPVPGVSWVGPLAAIFSVSIGWYAFANAVGDEDSRTN